MHPVERHAVPIPPQPARRRSAALWCSSCGQAPANPNERAEMAMTWLLPGTGPAAGLRVRHFCRGCAPTGRVADVVCVRCGDGPLLAGELVDDLDERLPRAVQGWLSAAGWQLSGPVCPDCVGELGR